ncbi:MAG: phospholipase D-like domain-containing protein [Sorangiineae bacterium]|nr:phospholipase D-like domain-containing protein [Polyangiaceae bacterium]MEB2324757.1 phospholipase D-like domain-containing protein [Sorangiineae bacterium]
MSEIGPPAGVRASGWSRLAERRTRRLLERLAPHETRLVAGNRLALLVDGAQAFPAMLDAIAHARRQILFEMYWFASDETGRRFARALESAAARGVEVALLYDSVGSWDSDRALFGSLEDAGVKVLEYGPIRPWERRFRLARLTRRDHRKILVIDGGLGFTGGLNVSDRWLPASEGGAEWRDYMAALEGPAVGSLAELFQGTWRAQGGPRLGASPPAPANPGVAPRVAVLGENYAHHRREIVQAYLYNIYRATRRVWITNSYFVPDHAVKLALERAARRGVDVRVLVPGESDVPIVRHASRAMWGGLLRSGVRIFEWYPSVLHGKTAVIDGEWGTIGSFNLDAQSLRSNLEVNLAVRDESFARVLERAFLADLETAREVDEREFRFRPLGDRLLEFIFYRFRKLL